jgi:site-specific recombinase XerD
VTSLVAAGVHPRVAQALARHAKIETTMKTYTDVHSLDLRGAIERIGSATPDTLARAKG